jgi:hypothetical protein
VHEADNWKKDLKILYERGKKTFVLATGSSALLLHSSSDLASRWTLLKIFPFRFPEFILAKSWLLNPETQIYPVKGIASHLKNTFFYSQNYKILKADILTKQRQVERYYNKTQKILHKENVVLTPHPKEFVHLLKITGKELCIEQLQRERFLHVKQFCQTYPNVVLLLKGANVIIGKKDRFFINDQGSNKLAKGGSGDVLSGLIAGLLAQGYDTLQATVQASLIHTQLAKKAQTNSFSLTPNDLINTISKL